jgi:hypothetical protein
MDSPNLIKKKFISGLLIVAILVPINAGIILAKPKQVKAFGPVVDVVDAVPTVTSFAKSIAAQILSQTLKAIARAFLNKITNSIITWINSGFQGQPGFVQNPSQFFGNIVDEQIKGFTNQIAYDAQSFPFGKNFALNVLNQTKSTTIQNLQSTISQLTTDSGLINGYQNNFGVGGWDGLVVNSQAPQNNIFGFQFLANNALQKQINGAVQPVQTQLQQSLGFLSQQQCASNKNWDPQKLQQGYQPPTYSPPTPPPTCTNMTSACLEAQQNYEQAKAAYDIQYQNQVKTGQKGFQQEYSCPEGPSTVTPGSVVANQVTTALSSGQHQSELAAAMGDVVGSIIDSLLNKLLNEGLTKLQGVISPNNTNTNINSSNFNQYGDTSSPNGTYVGNPATSLTQLTISMTVDNTKGGSLTQGQVQVLVDGKPVTNGDTTSVTAGTHQISVQINDPQASEYGAVYSGDCNLYGSINISSGGSGNCVVVVQYGAPATLNVTTTGVPPITPPSVRGLNIPPIAWQGQVDGNSVTAGAKQYNPGTYYVSGAPYPPPPSQPWQIVITGDCASDGSVTLGVGQNKSCVVNYIQQGQGSSLFGNLTVNTVVNNTNGGTLTSTSVPIYVDGVGKINNTSYPYSSGSHIVSTTLPAYYTDTITGDCAPDGSITLAAGDNKTCTITFNDTPGTGTAGGTLTVNVTVINNAGGTLQPSSVQFTVDGTFRYVGTSITLPSGTHTVLVKYPSTGYTINYGGGCNPDGTVSVSPGGSATCSIVLND